MDSPPVKSSARIGNCSGFYGDRLSAFREMLEGSAGSGGELDYLTGDYLAELTMLILGRDQMKDPSLGYAKTFVKQMADGMALAQEKGVKIVTNAGGLNPAGLADKLRAIATEQGLDVAIAHVDGDDVRDRFEGVLTANAYLGAFGIAEALVAGADVVVTGRVTDASVIVGPAIAHHGWGRDDLDALAGAVVAGHVIECGTQATGGNFSGFRSLDLSQPLGFPIAEVAADGSSVITKHEGTGGAVTVDTVTAQLMYEIQGPEYLNPDVTVRLDTMALAQEGPDRVAITGVVGTVPPPTTKVCLNTLNGFRNSIELVLTGLDIDEKAAWVKTQVGAALDPAVRVEWQLVRTDRPDPETEIEAACLLRCDVRSDDADLVGRRFSDAAIQVALASYPGFHVTRPPGGASPVGVYRADYLPQADVAHVVHHADGSTTRIEAPVVVDAEAEDSVTELRVVPDRDWGPTVRRPLGELVHARSGDKGGDANVGVWIPAGHPQRAEAAAWLAELLHREVHALLPEASALPVWVHDLPNLGGVNVVIHGLLGEGVASSTRFDPQAKAVGEWLRARHTDIPAQFLPEANA